MLEQASVGLKAVVLAVEVVLLGVGHDELEASAAGGDL